MSRRAGGGTPRDAAGRRGASRPDGAGSRPAAPGWRLLVTGGGTGGHIYPALAVLRRAAERYPPLQVLYVGGRGGLEEGIVPQQDVPFVSLPVRGLIRRRPAELAAGLAGLGTALWRALALVRRFRPHVVVGTGGYAAGPVGAAAWLAGVPLVVLEQNAVPGVTNRLLGRVAVGVAVPFDDAGVRRAFPRGTRLWPLGNPVRPEILDIPRDAARARMQLAPARPVVLMVAGSRGSAVFVRLLREWLAAWSGPAQLVFVAGRAHHEAARAALAERPRPGVRVLPYLDDVGDAYAAADLVVARAGAITLAELAAVGRPSVLIPSLHVTHHHQEANAAVFARAGAAVVLGEAGLDGARLGREVGALVADPARLAAMAAASRSLGRPDALDELVERVHRIALGY